MKTDHGATEAARHGVARSPHWPKVEKAFLAAHPECACCKPGQNPGAGMQVHHKFPFHYAVALGRPDLELDPRNLITLCETEHDKPSDNHHLLVGHLDDFKSSNLVVEANATSLYHGMTADEIKGDTFWVASVAKRLKALDQMTMQDKQEFAHLMNTTYPAIPHVPS